MIEYVVAAVTVVVAVAVVVVVVVVVVVATVTDSCCLCSCVVVCRYRWCSRCYWCCCGNSNAAVAVRLFGVVETIFLLWSLLLFVVAAVIVGDNVVDAIVFVSFAAIGAPLVVVGLSAVNAVDVLVTIAYLHGLMCSYHRLTGVTLHWPRQVQVRFHQHSNDSQQRQQQQHQ